MTQAERSTHRRGNYSMMMGFAVIGILGFGALGVDISYIAMANGQAQAVADAASHAALIAYRNNTGDDTAKRSAGDLAGNWIVDNNFVGLNGPGELSQLQYGQFNSSTGVFSGTATPVNSVRARVERPSTNALDLIVSPIIGVNEATVDQSGVTVANPREIVLVIDRSCSMVGSGEVGTGDAIATFRQYMIDTRLPLDRIGATWFAGDGQGGNWQPFQLIEGNIGTMTTNWTSANWQAFCCNGATDQEEGMRRARTMLNSSGNDLAFKAMIVISDGNPNPASLNAAFQAEANTAWAQGIHVWTVGFGSINSNIMFNASKGLGKPASVAAWNAQYKAPNAAGVQQIVRRIAESIPVAMVE